VRTSTPAWTSIDVLQEEHVARVLAEQNLKAAWRRRWLLTVEQRARLEQACAQHWGPVWRTIVEFEHG
jgi:hypothetical protein